MHAVVADGGRPKESAKNCQYNTGRLSSTSTQGLTHGGAADVALALGTHLSVNVLAEMKHDAVHFNSHFPQEWLVIYVGSCIPPIRSKRQFSRVLRGFGSLNCFFRWAV